MGGIAFFFAPPFKISHFPHGNSPSKHPIMFDLAVKGSSDSAKPRRGAGEAEGEREVGG